VIDENHAVSIGEVLADARHQRGFTVADVSHYTRVREQIIRAIEQDDYALSGTEAHARSDVQAIAIALGIDPGPLMRAFDEAYRSAPLPVPRSAPLPVPVQAIPPVIPFGRVGRDGAFGRIEPRRVRWLPIVAVLVLAAAGFAVYHFVFAGPATSSRQATASPSAAPVSSAPAAAGPGAVTPVRVTAFGPQGTADGDNPQLAGLAVDGDPATAWTTGLYASPQFATSPTGAGQPGTGLLLDMGQAVTITGAEVRLGAVPGADFQMRAGNTPSLTDLPAVAVAANAGGVMAVRFTAPVHARYVLIWFTKLPPASVGTFQASVYNVTVQGSLH
jgi:transcriptional regulator with XRE-family HTH domain